MKELEGLEEFLDEYPGMSIASNCQAGWLLLGKFHFKAKVPGYEEIEDSYWLSIQVPEKFPQDLPTVHETKGRIPVGGNFHVNKDGSFCLGSPLILLREIYKNPNFYEFSKRIIIPFLYAVSYKFRHGGSFLLGELDHGVQGIFDDYTELFKLKQPEKVLDAVQLLGMKKRIANKKSCPCGCGKRLGSCPFHLKLNELRKMAPLKWFRDQHHKILDQIWAEKSHLALRKKLNQGRNS